MVNILYIEKKPQESYTAAEMREESAARIRQSLDKLNYEVNFHRSLKEVSQAEIDKADYVIASLPAEEYPEMIQMFKKYSSKGFVFLCGYYEKEGQFKITKDCSGAVIISRPSKLEHIVQAIELAKRNPQNETPIQ